MLKIEYKICNSNVLNACGCQYRGILRTDIKTNFNGLFSCRVLDVVVLYCCVLQLNYGDLLARVYLTFYERSGSRVNEHTLIYWLFITSSLPSVYAQRRFDLRFVHIHLDSWH